MNIKKRLCVVVTLLLLCILGLCACGDKKSSAKDTITNVVSTSDFEGTLVAGDISLLESSAKIEDYSDIGFGTEIYYDFVVQNNSGYTLTSIGIHVLILDDEENILGTSDGWIDAKIANGKKATISESFTYDDYPNAVSIRVDSGLYDGDGDNNVFEIDFLDEDISNTEISIVDLIPDDSDEIETVQVTTKSETEIAYEEACSLTINDLEKKTSNFSGTTHYFYNGLIIQTEDEEWLTESWNTEKSLNQGALYRTIASYLEGFSMGLNNGSDYSEIMCGVKWTSKDDFKPYAYNAMTFIVTSQPLKPIMQALEGANCVEGKFDYDTKTLGSYDFIIHDLTDCASELKISEEMLGYVIAMLSEYAPMISFEDNSCHIQYEGVTEKIDPLEINDFVVDFPSENSTINILDELNMEYGDESFYYAYYDVSVDASKEGVIETNRGIHIGDKKESVINAYGEADINPVVLQNSDVYQAILYYDESMAGIMRTQCINYVKYSYSGTGSIEFYFNENNLVSWIIFYNY